MSAPIRESRAVLGMKGSHDLDASGGFASIDALTALTIFTITLSLSLGATQVASRAADRAKETQDATLLLRHLIDGAGLATKAGREARFAWSVASIPAALPGSRDGFRVCAKNAVALSKASGRRYQLSTLVPCPL